MEMPSRSSAQGRVGPRGEQFERGEAVQREAAQRVRATHHRRVHHPGGDQHGGIEEGPRAGGAGGRDGHTWPGEAEPGAHKARQRVQVVGARVIVARQRPAFAAPRPGLLGLLDAGGRGAEHDGDAPGAMPRHRRRHRRHEAVLAQRQFRQARVAAGEGGQRFRRFEQFRLPHPADPDARGQPRHVRRVSRPPWRACRASRVAARPVPIALVAVRAEMRSGTMLVRWRCSAAVPGRWPAGMPPPRRWPRSAPSRGAPGCGTARAARR